MPRCRKILANGKRCKAHAIAGSKFCLFHTPNQPMRRGHRSSTNVTQARSKPGIQVSIENQVAMRGSRYLGAALAASAVRYMERPDYTIVKTNEPARINRQGTTYVSAHQRRVIEPTRSDGGRNFKQTDNPQHKRKVATSKYRVGKMIPYLGIGYMAYNLGTNWGKRKRKSEWDFKPSAEGFWLHDIYTGGEYLVRESVTFAAKVGVMNLINPFTLPGAVEDLT